MDADVPAPFTLRRVNRVPGDHRTMKIANARAEELSAKYPGIEFSVHPIAGKRSYYVVGINPEIPGEGNA